MTDTYSMTTAEARADWLENRKREIDEQVDVLRRLREFSEAGSPEYDLIDRRIDELLVEKDNLSLSVPAGWIEPEGTRPSPFVWGGEVFDPNPVAGSEEIPF